MADTRSLRDHSPSDASLALAAVVFTVATVLLMLSGDSAVVQWIRSFRAGGSGIAAAYESLRPVLVIITHGTTLITLSALLYLYGRLSCRPGLRGLGASLVAGFLISGITAQVLKHLIGRIRPWETDFTVFVGPNLGSGRDSFPSGHSTVAFCLAVLLSRRFPNWTPLFFGFALVTALDRVAGLAHFPSDVLAGALLGIGTAEVVLRRWKTTGGEWRA